MEEQTGELMNSISSRKIIYFTFQALCVYFLLAALGYWGKDSLSGWSSTVPHDALHNFQF